MNKFYKWLLIEIIITIMLFSGYHWYHKMIIGGQWTVLPCIHIFGEWRILPFFKLDEGITIIYNIEEKNNV